MRNRALVVFSGQTDFWWQRFLKPGYRHCGVVVECGRQWLVVEPLSTHLHFRLFPRARGNLALSLRRKGLEVVETFVGQPQQLAMLPSIFTCVDVVKRALGLRAPLVLTPWQLRKEISKLGKKTLK